MTEGRLMRSEKLIWREIDDEIVIIRENGQGLYVLNKTAARIWEMCSGELEPDEIAVRLCERYDVTPEKARTDVRNAVTNMREKGLLE